MRFDINETLLRHIATGGGAASALRKAAQAATGELTQFIEELFDARSDVRRLHRAQQVSRTILHIYDFGDIMGLRDIVAQQELRGLISYEKQKDHTAHTVYLYLLGIWFFDHVPVFRSAVKAKGKCQTEKETCNRFLFQWLFASLLHDIGYAFYDLSKETTKDRRRIDDIYSWNWLNDLFGNLQKNGRTLSQGHLDELRNVHHSFEETYGKDMLPGTAQYGPGAQDSVIKRLAQAPWLVDLNSDWKNKNIFDVLKISDKADLQVYAKTVAEDGYGGNKTTACVDHAVASGLLLFQYSSYWYWLLHKLKSNNQEAYNDLVKDYDYQLSNVSTFVVEACRAVAYHNVQLSVSGGANILSCVTLEEEPILYLAIVCDELQNWDRYPAGDKLLLGFEAYSAASLEGGDIELNCSGTDTIKATFRIKHEQQSEIVVTMNNVLASRLQRYQQIVSIEEYLQ